MLYYKYHLFLILKSSYFGQDFEATNQTQNDYFFLNFRRTKNRNIQDNFITE